MQFYYYEEEDMTEVYDHNIIQALKKVINEKMQQLGDLEMELEKTLNATCKELEGCCTQNLFAEIVEEEKQLDQKVRKLKNIMKIRSELLKIHEGSHEVARVSGNDEVLEYHKTMISAKEENILKLIEEINPLKSRLRHIRLPNEELGEAKKEVVRLMRLKQTLLDSINKDKEFVNNLEIVVGLSNGTQHPCLGETSVGEVEEVTVTIQTCALCKQPFPKFDILLAPCSCAYHPWCAVCQIWRLESCAKKQCKKEFPMEWRQSMGLNKLRG